MQILNLSLNGFGVHESGEFEFDAPGLNVILGDNESGKSTLCVAIAAIVYGFPDTKTESGFRSWGSSDDYCGRLELQIGDLRYVIERDFETNEALISRLVDGNEEILFDGDANPRGRTEEPKQYRRMLVETLGLPSETVLRNSAYVDQLGLEVTLDEELRKQLSGAGQGDYKKASQALRNSYHILTRERLPHESRGGKRSDQHIEICNTQIGGLTRELEVSEELALRLASTGKDLEEMRADLDACRARLGLRQGEHSALARYLADARDIDSLLDQEEALQSQAREIERLNTNIEAFEKQIGEPKYEGLLKLSKQELGRLKEYVYSDSEHTHKRIDALKREEAALNQQLGEERYRPFAQAPANTGDRLSQMKPIESRIAELRLQAEKLSDPAKPSSTKWVWWMAAGLIVAGLIIGAGAGYLVTQGQTAINPALGSLFGSMACGMLWGLVGTVLALLIKARAEAKPGEVKALGAKLEEQQRALSDLEEELKPVLEAAGKDVSRELLIERWKAYCDLKAKLDAAEHEGELLEGSTPKDQRDDSKLGPILAAESSERLKERIETFEGIRADLEAAHEARERLTKVDPEDNLKLAQIARDRKEALTHMQSAEEAYPSFEVLRGDRTQGLKRLEALKGEINQLNSETESKETGLLTKTREEMEIQVKAFRPPAVIQEELEAVQERLSRAIRKRDALILAIRTLDEAIRTYEEEHLVRLSHATSAYFERLTLGNHTEVSIGQDGEIEVTCSEADAVASDRLSTGAYDQLYLSLRLAVLDLLAGDLPLPIILDDSFVNFDSRRLKEAKHLVDQLAKERQVILLSHEEKYRSWSKKVIDLSDGEGAS